MTNVEQYQLEPIYRDRASVEAQTDDEPTTSWCGLVRRLRQRLPGDRLPDWLSRPLWKRRFACRCSSAAFSVRGAKRKRNEDCWQISEDQASFVVADGMGGYPAGDTASQLTVRVTIDELSGLPQLHSKRQALEELNRVFKKANSQVVQSGRTRDRRGMGAAVIAAVCSKGRLYIAGVGDCRAYLLRGDQFKQLTTDDTLAASLLRTGLVTEDQINRHAFKNLLSRCIGTDPFQPTDEVKVVSLHGDDRLLLCSDGLPKALGASEVEHTLATSQTADEAAARLRQLVEARQPRDDTTAIVLFPDCQISEPAAANQRSTAAPAAAVDGQGPTCERL